MNSNASPSSPRGGPSPKPAARPRSVPLPVAPDGAPPPAIDRSVWYAEGLRFECTQCGNCCGGAPGYVWLTTDDMERIAAHLKLPFNDFTRTYVRRIGNRYSLTEKFNYDCTFLTRDKDGKSGCMIYHVRPTQCRTWPFWKDNLKSPAAWQAASEKCPGMCESTAPKYDLEHIEACKQHTDSPR